MSSSASSGPSLDGKALFYMCLLAFQFGLQPSLTRHFTPPDINRSTVILVQECLKFGLAALMLRLSCSTQQLTDLYSKWSLAQWFQVAAVPSALYAVQNVAALTAYQNLDALSFTVLNQTKTLSAALCCYLIMGRSQSLMQVLALLLLLASALVMERIVPLPAVLSSSSSSSSDSSLLLGQDNSNNYFHSWETKHWTHGVAPILLASFISGLAGALSQKNLQSAGGGRNPYWFSMELCAASALMLGLKLLVNNILKEDTTTATTIQDGTTTNSMWDGWTWTTLIPVATNSAGGIVVGLVTKYAGSVRKGFALIFGIVISGLIQEFFTNPKEEGGGRVRPEQVVGGLLAAFSLYLHSTHPPTDEKKPKASNVDDKKKTN